MKYDINAILAILKYETDDNIREILNNKEINWINVLGYLSYHRVAGLAYEKANDIDIRLFDYPVFLSTYLINQAQRIRCIEHQKYVDMISNELNKKKISYVFLKGTVLNNIIYNYGSRASNDIDLLINKKDIKAVTNILKKLGFIQGVFDYKNNKIIEYSNKDISEIENNIGETAAFVKISDTPTAKTIDIDVNFSLDWKPTFCEKTINRFLDNKILVENPNTGNQIYSLCYRHMFIELCVHFYKDSVLIDQINKRKILDLYKIIDIYYFIMKFFKEINVQSLYNDISESKLDNQIYFTLMHILTLFPDAKTKEVIKLLNMLNTDNNDLNIIFDQYDNDIKMFTDKSIYDRVFAYDLINLYRDDKYE